MRNKPSPLPSGWRVAALALALSGGAQAQTAGLAVRARALRKLSLQVTTVATCPRPASRAPSDVRVDTQPAGGYHLHAHRPLAVDCPWHAFKHDVIGAGAIAGVGKIGEVKVLPRPCSRSTAF